MIDFLQELNLGWTKDATETAGKYLRQHLVISFGTLMVFITHLKIDPVMFQRFFLSFKDTIAHRKVRSEGEMQIQLRKKNC